MSASNSSRALGALGVVVIVVAGCSASVTPAPSASVTPPASTAPSESAGSPTAAPPASTAPTPATPAPPSTTPTAAATPTAVPVTPAPTGAWVPAGTIPPDMYGVTVVRVLRDAALAIARDALSTARWDPGTAAWIPASPMNAGRSDYAAVALSDGRALVVGGVDTRTFDRWRSYSSAYVFDATTPKGAWTKVGLMGTARAAPAVALLPDGRVLVAGGAYIDGSPWGLVGPSGITLAVARPGQTGPGSGGIRRFDDMAAPSIGRALATAEILDPASGRWTSTGSMRFARAGAVATTLSDGRVLIVGPSSLETGDFRAEMDPRVFDTAEVFDPATGRFTLVGSLPPIDRGAIAADGVAVPTSEPYSTSVGTLIALPDGGAFLVGHGDSWKHEASVTRSFRFDGGTGRWTQVGPAFAGSADWSGAEAVWHYTPGINLEGAFAGGLPDGHVLVAGGSTVDEKSGDWSASRTARAWDPATGGWAPLPPMPGARDGGSTVVLGEGSVLLIGGDMDDQGVETAVRFVPGG